MRRVHASKGQFLRPSGAAWKVGDAFHELRCAPLVATCLRPSGAAAALLGAFRMAGVFGGFGRAVGGARCDPRTEASKSGGDWKELGKTPSLTVGVRGWSGGNAP